LKSKDGDLRTNRGTQFSKRSEETRSLSMTAEPAVVKEPEVLVRLVEKTAACGTDCAYRTYRM